MATPRYVEIFQAIFHQEGMKADLQISTPEDPDEKRLRLLKERWSFYVKELGPYAMAAVFVVVMSVYCFWVLVSGHSAPDDKARAWPALLAILGGVVGVVFGKATSK